MRIVVALVVLSVAACVTPAPDDAAQRLTDAMQRRPVVLLGEVHDNEAQHALRAEALRRVVEAGARPAIAFEQFDRERQADLDRARSEPLPAGADRIDYMIAQAKGASSWNWKLYRPYLRIALEHDLPIVAANLSRADAMRVGQQGFGAQFDSAAQSALGLNQLPETFLREHRNAVDIGHCKLMPAAMLPALAQAQIARDATLAQSIRPHVARGVVLLAGNGHVRNDTGVPFFLTAAERARTTTIGLLESSEDNQRKSAMQFDVTIVTPPQRREDPCAALRKRYSPVAG